MNGYVSQRIAEEHIADLRAQAARSRLRAQAAQAAQVSTSRVSQRLPVWPARLRLDAESARRAQPLGVPSGTRVTTVRVRPAVDC
jgi:hypothetical protein